MRAYFFGNMYLSSIQQGIQALHVVSEMLVKYTLEDNRPGLLQRIILQEWARDYKTVVLLNAGFSSEIRSLTEFFANEANPYPWARFYEEGDALDGALTSIGIVIPEKIYELSAQLRQGEELFELFAAASLAGGKTKDIMSFDINEYNDWELEFARRLNNYGLAK